MPQHKPLKRATRKITVSAPKEGQPTTETLVVQWDVKVEDTDIATTTPSTTAVEGSTLQIEDEYMIVTDASNADNLAVKRGAFGTTVAAHVAGTSVSVWGESETGPSGKHPILRSELKGVGATMTRQMTGEEANATRSRNIVDWPPPLKTHAEHVAELEEEAQKQEDFNNEQNAIQTDIQAPFREVMLRTGDPLNADEERDKAMEQFKAEIDLQDRAKEAAVKGERAGARATRDRDAEQKRARDEK